MKIHTIEAQIGENLIVRFDKEPTTITFKWKNLEKNYIECIMLDEATVINLLYLIRGSGLI